MRSRFIVVSWILALVLFLLVETVPLVRSQSLPYELRINWVKISNPTNLGEYAYGVCLLGQHLFVVGFENQTSTGINYAWRIEQRHVDTGELVTTYTIPFANGGNNRLFDCVSNATHVIAVGTYYAPSAPPNPLSYVVGVAVVNPISSTWSVYYFDQSIYEDAGLSVDTNGTHFYLAGYTRYTQQPYDLDWLAASFNHQTFEGVVKRVGISTGDDLLISVAVNPVTGEAWFAGYYTGGDGYPRWGLRIYSLDFGEAGVTDLTDVVGYAYSIAFDTEGNAFVVGSTGVRKYSSAGTYLGNVTYLSGYKALYYRDRVVVIGNYYNATANSYKPAIYFLNPADMSLEGGMFWILAPNYPYDITVNIGKAATDGSNIYFAASIDFGNGDYGWIIYSLTIVEQPIPINEPWYIDLILAVFAVSLATYAVKKVFKD